MHVEEHAENTGEIPAKWRLVELRLYDAWPKWQVTKASFDPSVTCPKRKIMFNLTCWVFFFLYSAHRRADLPNPNVINEKSMIIWRLGQVTLGSNDAGSLVTWVRRHTAVTAPRPLIWPARYSSLKLVKCTESYRFANYQKYPESSGLFISAQWRAYVLSLNRSPPLGKIDILPQIGQIMLFPLSRFYMK